MKKKQDIIDAIDNAVIEFLTFQESRPSKVSLSPKLWAQAYCASGLMRPERELLYYSCGGPPFPVVILKPDYRLMGEEMVVQ